MTAVVTTTVSLKYECVSLFKAQRTIKIAPFNCMINCTPDCRADSLKQPLSFFVNTNVVCVEWLSQYSKDGNGTAYINAYHGLNSFLIRFIPTS